MPDHQDQEFFWGNRAVEAAEAIEVAEAAKVNEAKEVSKKLEKALMSTVGINQRLSDLKEPGTSKLYWRYLEHNKIDRN